ncbi:MAG TPA: hypothetical protein VMF08_10320 [Candidatus Sulfotelmatobacter sp.]|nr:hypothetical protein [Candidatus Sulfotelmatobacter sp.]
MQRDALVTEARAKIIWGEPLSSVRYFLISNGMSEDDANATIRQFMEERESEIRKNGIRDIIIGVVCIISSAVMFYGLFLHRFSGSLVASNIEGAAGSVPIALFGIWKLVRGVIFLVRPQSDTKSLAETE